MVPFHILAIFHRWMLHPEFNPDLSNRAVYSLYFLLIAWYTH